MCGTPDDPVYTKFRKNIHMWLKKDDNSMAKLLFEALEPKYNNLFRTVLQNIIAKDPSFSSSIDAYLTGVSHGFMAIEVGLFYFFWPFI